MTAKDVEFVEHMERMMKNCRHGGPSEEERNTPWLASCGQFARTDWNHSLTSNSSQNEIKSKLYAVIRLLNTRVDFNLILSRMDFNLILSFTGSKKFFASLAVDAWINQDKKYAQRFLTTSLLLEKLQNVGSNALIQQIEDNTDSGSRLLRDIQCIYQDEYIVLKTFLQRLTAGEINCKCVDLAYTLQMQKQAILNTDHQELEAKMNQSKIESLPPILTKSSKYWPIKKRAAKFLQKGNLEDAKKLYNEAKKILEEDKSFDYEYRKEWAVEISTEAARVVSNLSLLFLKQNLYEEALMYANEAVSRCPLWSKPFCRRAVALESLNQLDEAHSAIFKAITMATIEVNNRDLKTKTLEEYKSIRSRIEKALESSNKPAVHNPLFNSLNIPPGGIDLAVGLFTEEGLLYKTYEYLAPNDVSKLQHTCSIRSEKCTRITMTNILRNTSSLSPKSVKSIKNILQVFCNEVNKDRNDAFRVLILAVRVLVPDNFWSKYLRLEGMHQSSYSTILSVCRPGIIKLPYCNETPSCQTFCIYKYLLLNDKVDRTTKLNALSQLSDMINEDEGSLIILRIVRYGIDDDIMQLCGEFDEADELCGTTLLVLNSIVQEGHRRRKKLNPSHPIYITLMSFHETHSLHIPTPWPGDDMGQCTLRNQEWLEEYWREEDPNVFRLWKAGIFKCLKIVQKMEHISDQFILITKDIIIHSNRGRVFMDCYSFPLFLVKKALENDGAVALSRKLIKQKDFAKLIIDYYAMVELYNDTFPEIIEWRDRTIAQHQSLYNRR